MRPANLEKSALPPAPVGNRIGRGVYDTYLELDRRSTGV